MPGLHQGGVHAAIDVDAVPPVAFRPAVRWQLALGFALMLLSTGAHMIPPYLTIPLMDNVLIPYQNGKPVDPAGGAVHGRPARRGHAGVDFGLGQTYVLALVSERIGADLRTTTYEHLLSCRWNTSAASVPAI
jgi:ATP-binding cassette subfamily B protein